MPTLPQLLEEDIQSIEEVLNDYLDKSDASIAMVIDKGGFLISHRGDARRFDLTTIGALASGAYMANQTIANLINEDNFDSVYQQGEKNSMFVTNIDENCLWMVVFSCKIGVGVVKYHAAEARTKIAKQLQVAQARDPDAGLDLSVMNMADPSELFRKRS
jgi:predicted regulator of Ras-like GTPase activity (Roadblock/LC7/MglB family)